MLLDNITASKPVISLLLVEQPTVGTTGTIGYSVGAGCLSQLLFSKNILQDYIPCIDIESTNYVEELSSKQCFVARMLLRTEELTERDFRNILLHGSVSNILEEDHRKPNKLFFVFCFVFIENCLFN